MNKNINKLYEKSQPDKASTATKLFKLGLVPITTNFVYNSKKKSLVKKFPREWLECNETNWEDYYCKGTNGLAIRTRGCTPNPAIY